MKIQLNEIMNNPDDILELYKFKHHDFYFFENSKLCSFIVAKTHKVITLPFYILRLNQELTGSPDKLVKSFNINELRILVILKPNITIEELISYALKQSY